MAMLLITHDLGVVAETADRVVVMYAGQKVEEGRVEDVFRSPRHPYTVGLLAAARYDRDRGRSLREIPRIGAQPIRGSDRLPLRTAMLPRDRPLLRRPSSSRGFRTRPRCCLHPRGDAPGMNGPVLKVRGLVKHYPLSDGLFCQPKVVRAVDGVSFELRKGEIFSIVGEFGLWQVHARALPCAPDPANQRRDPPRRR